ncbi:MAG: hypothetical protein ACLQU2_00180 [Candidatus Binataceae bacterium]
MTLILACILHWQAREISRVLSQHEPVANGVDLTLLEHVSPIEWDNVVLYSSISSIESSSDGTAGR